MENLSNGEKREENKFADWQLQSLEIANGRRSADAAIALTGGRSMRRRESESEPQDSPRSNRSREYDQHAIPVAGVCTTIVAI